MVGCLWTRVRKQPILALYFESVAVFKFYNLEANTGSGGFMFFVVLCPGGSEDSTSSVSGFKASQKTGPPLKVLYNSL